MTRLLIVTGRESALSRLMARYFDCAVTAPDRVCAEDLGRFDALALLGGTDDEGMLLYPPARAAVDRQIALGKPVFAEYVRGVGSVSCLEAVGTRFERPVLMNAHPAAADIAPGTIFDEQSNTRLTVYKAINRARPILQYVRSPRGFYAVKDVSSIDIDLSRFALWQDEKNLLVCSFRLCDFDRAKFAPRAAWARLICGIIAFLGGAADETECLAAFHRAYRLRGGTDPAAAALKAMAWFERAGMLAELDGAPYGVREGLSPEVTADGRHHVMQNIRMDNTGMTALAYLLKAMHTGDARDRAVSDGLYRMVRDMQITDDGPHRGMVRGDYQAWWQVSYQDDAARGFLLPLILRQTLTGETGDQDRIKMALDYLLATTGTDGLRAMRVDFYDPHSDRVEVTGMHAEPDPKDPSVRRWRWGGGISGATTIGALSRVPAGVPSAHYNGFYMAALLLGGRLLHEDRYIEAGERGLKSIRAVYPDTAREHSQTQELCRLIFPLAALCLARDTDEHRAWLYRVARDLQAFRHPGGGYIEWDTGYTAACAGVSDGESSVLCENGDPVMDLLYSLNWLPMGFIAAYYATGDSWFKGLWDDIARFLASIQIESDDPLIDGVWPRAFDADRREVYGVPNDVGWAPWSVESGWTVAGICAGMMCAGGNFSPLRDPPTGRGRGSKLPRHTTPTGLH